MNKFRNYILIVLLIFTISFILIENYYKNSKTFFINENEFPNDVYDFICNNISDSIKLDLINLNQKDFISMSFKYTDSSLFDFSFLSKRIDTTILNSLASDLNGLKYKFEFTDEKGDYGGLIKFKKLCRKCK